MPLGMAEDNVRKAMSNLAHYWDSDEPCECIECRLWLKLREILKEIEAAKLAQSLHSK